MNEIGRTQKVLAFFKDYDPFQESNELRNIANGVTGPASANPHLLYQVGMNIVQKMEGSNAFDFSFRKKDQVESLGAKSTNRPTAPLPEPPHLC